MPSTVEVDGEEYDLTDNPSMGTVKEVQQMQMGLLMRNLDEDELRDMESFSESEFLGKIIDKQGMDAVGEMVWGRSILSAAQTISLATDEVFDIDEIESMGSRDFQKLLNAAEEELGGDADDFFNELNVGTSLTEREAQNLEA